MLQAPDGRKLCEQSSCRWEVFLLLIYCSEGRVEVVQRGFIQRLPWGCAKFLQRLMTNAKEETERAMEPWEQHHAVINMPRYAYKAASVLNNRYVGFLITCTFRREKSATKEALGLLREYMKVTEVSNGVGAATTKTSADYDAESNLEKAVGKRVELLNTSSTTAEETTTETLPAGDVKSASLEAAAEGYAESRANDVQVTSDITGTDCSVSKEKGEAEKPKEESEHAESDGHKNSAHDVQVTSDITGTDCSVSKEKGEAEKPKEENGHAESDGHKNSSEVQEFMLIKLDTMGIIYISATQESSPSVLSIVSRIINDVRRSLRPPPQWCHRILPVQGTCSTRSEELQELVSRLVTQHLENTSSSGADSLNYAVAFNRRGADGSSDKKTFDRGECIKVVTAAVNEVIPNVKVDLSSPQMVVVVELIPVSGISSLMCAVSVLPGDLVISKPKLTVKPLAPESRKRKHR
ncbi:hypothetical protein R1flu_024803 [Riccia fluitans]|uniref:THUMP domain-containing protein n=1 Tax=Riccia fluitans TaxID=41844 RepID=A0ABD1XYY6_9MARC